MELSMNHPGEIGFSLNRKALYSLLCENVGSDGVDELEHADLLQGVLDSMQEAYQIGKQNPDIVSSIKSLNTLVASFDPS